MRVQLSEVDGFRENWQCELIVSNEDHPKHLAPLGDRRPPRSEIDPGLGFWLYSIWTNTPRPEKVSRS